jgi:SET domain-containing protein
MALLEKQLEVKPSTIPDSGMGLFTRQFIPRGTRIVEYKGRITTWDDVKDDHDNGYIYSVSDAHVIDARRHVKALARYANDARGISRIKGVANNCTYVNDGVKVYIESVRDIEAGSEILVSYGKEYWDVIRANIRADREREKERKAKEKKAKAKGAKGAVKKK